MSYSDIIFFFSCLFGFYLLSILVRYIFINKSEKRQAKAFERNFIPDPSLCLYILGNGFDLFHDIPSKYSDFKLFLKENNTELLNLMEEYYDKSILWSDWEEALGTLDFRDGYLSDKWGWDWADHNDKENEDRQEAMRFAQEIERVTMLLETQTKIEFCKWIQQIKIPAVQLLTFKKKALFLNFNYTNTLESLYQIPDELITYIHNSAAKTNDLIFGHSNLESKAPGFFYYLISDGSYRGLDEANEYQDKYLKSTLKRVKSNIREKSVFFNKASVVSKIFIVGHSLSKVDIEYFRFLKKSVSEYTEWIASYYLINDKEKYFATLIGLGIPADKIKMIPTSELSTSLLD